MTFLSQRVVVGKKMKKRKKRKRERVGLDIWLTRHIEMDL